MRHTGAPAHRIVEFGVERRCAARAARPSTMATRRAMRQERPLIERPTARTAGRVRAVGPGRGGRHPSRVSSAAALPGAEGGDALLELLGRCHGYRRATAGAAEFVVDAAV